MKWKPFLLIIAVIALIFPIYIRTHFHYPPETWNLLQIGTLIMILLYPRWIVLVCMLGVTGGIIYAWEPMFSGPISLSPFRMVLPSIITNGLLLMIVMYYRIQSDTAMKKLEELSFRDPLTNLWNRRYFEHYKEKSFQVLQKKTKEQSIIVCDIDHFKKINDTYGHLLGDDVIKAVAGLLKEQSRTSDIAVRLGGEEFLIFLPDTGAEEAFQIAESIRQSALDCRVQDQENTISFTLSFGIAVYNGRESVQQFIHRADQALYQAKESGRNRTCLHTAETEHSF